MSVAAMTLDDQRPMMNNYENKMTTNFEQNLRIDAGNSSVELGNVDGNVSSANANSYIAPPSGPASPTPSVSEEPVIVAPSLTGSNEGTTAISSPDYNPHHHHNHHLHHHHQGPPSPSSQEQLLKQQEQAELEQQQQQQKLQEQQQLEQQKLQQQLEQQQAIAAAVAASEKRQRMFEEELENIKLEHHRMGQQCAEAMRREKILIRRLANKEQEFQDYVSQIAEFKAQQAPTAISLRTALLDPAVNLLFEKYQQDLAFVKMKLEETQNELAAWKFTPDSNTGKRLLAKCRLLYQENEELGKLTSNGRLARLSNQLTMQKSFNEEVKKSQSELDDFLQELDEDVEGMQSTILFLQQELKGNRDRIHTLEKENYELKMTVKSNDINGDSGDSSREHTKFVSSVPSAPVKISKISGPTKATIKGAGSVKVAKSSGKVVKTLPYATVAKIPAFASVPASLAKVPGLTPLPALPTISALPIFPAPATLSAAPSLATSETVPALATVAAVEAVPEVTAGPVIPEAPALEPVATVSASAQNEDEDNIGTSNDNDLNRAAISPMEEVCDNDNFIAPMAFQVPQVPNKRDDLNSTKMDTIVEDDDCLNESLAMPATGMTAVPPTPAHQPEYNYNGSDDMMPIEPFVYGLDDSNSNGSVGMRNTRKRNYEGDLTCQAEAPTTTSTVVSAAITPPDDVLDNITAVTTTHTIVQQVNTTPRTLPPKKSKLRLTARSDSEQDTMSGDIMQPSTMNMVVDNAVAGMASEEISTSGSVDTPLDVNVATEPQQQQPQQQQQTQSNDDTIPARIMTRRRSVRMQQQNSNGSAADF